MERQFRRWPSLHPHKLAECAALHPPANGDREESEPVEDLWQLFGLCERLDQQAFLPLRSEELTGTETAARYLQFCQIAYDVGEELLKLEGFNRNRFQTRWRPWLLREL